MSGETITPIEGSNVLADLAARINAEHTEVGALSQKGNDVGAPRQLAELFRAVAAYAAGGIKALEATPGAARLLTFFDRRSPNP